MKIKGLLIVNAVVLGGSGIFALLLPDKVLSLYGVESFRSIYSQQKSY